MSAARRMAVLAIVQYAHDISPGQRYRIEQWQPLLEREGIDLTFAPFHSEEATRIYLRPGRLVKKATATVAGVIRRARDLARAGRFEAAFLYRDAAPIGPAIIEPLIARRIPYVYDFDDAIFLPRVSDVNRAFAFLKSHRKVDAICRAAAHVTVGNDYLAAYARRHNDHVTVIPTTVDTDRYVPRPRAPHDELVIGWSGSPTTAPYLDELRPVFEALIRIRPFRLRVIGAPEFRPIDGVPTDLVPWSSATEIDELAKIDIGLMPSPDEEWALGKCGLKALLHMAMGQPVVCSPVGVARNIVDHGTNGFLAASADEWVARLCELLDSADLRRRLGTAGRATVERRYSATSQAPRLAEIFYSLREARAAVLL